VSHFLPSFLPNFVLINLFFPLALGEAAPRNDAARIAARWCLRGATALSWVFRGPIAATPRGLTLIFFRGGLVGRVAEDRRSRGHESRRRLGCEVDIQ